MGVEVKTKNGYVKIANNLFDNIIFRDFTNRERAVIFLIIRLSYGFNHKVAIIKPKARFGLIGVHRQHIDRALDSLMAKNVVISRGNDEYALNKHFDEWNVKLNKHFDEDNFNALKGLQFRGNVTTTVTNCNQECNNESNHDGYKEVTTGVTQSNQIEINEVTTTVTNLENCNNGGYNNVTPVVTNSGEMLPRRLQTQPENVDGGEDTTDPKDIFKDNIKTYIKDISLIGKEEQKTTQKFDPYFNNPIVEKFKKEYEKIFKTQRCYLDNFKINKLIEIAADNPDFLEKLPEVVKKFSKLKFTNAPATLKWLINEGGWAGILNGEYDRFIQEDTQDDIDGWDIGIPIANLED